jgi:hypothetical protein
MLIIGMALLAVSAVLLVRLDRSASAGIDFLPTYVAGRALLHGHAPEIYESLAQTRQYAQILPGQVPSHNPFLNPPGAALLAAPLALLRFSVADRLWAVLQAILLVSSTLLLLPQKPRWALAFPALVFCLGSAFCALDILLGQWDGVTVLGLALCWRWRAQSRPLAAGLALGLLGGLAKPHLLAGVAIYLVVRREWRLVATAAGGAIASVVAPALLLSPHLLVDFIRTVGSSSGDPVSQRFVSLSGLLASWFGNSPISHDLGLGVSALALVVAGWLGTRTGRDDLCLGGAAVTLSLLASPHLLGYDAVLLVPFLCARLLQNQRLWIPICGVVALDLASWLDLGNAQLFPPGRLTPLVLGALALWWFTESQSRSGERLLSSRCARGSGSIGRITNGHT